MVSNLSETARPSLGTSQLSLKRVLIVNSLSLAVLAALVAGCVLFRDTLVETALGGRAGRFETGLTRLVLSAVLGQVLLNGVLFWKQVRETLVQFFRREDHALNLAVLRIVVFLLLLTGYGAKASWYAGLPEELRFPPAGLGRLADLGLEELLYFSPAQVEIAYAVFFFFCVTGLLGLFSRTSALVVVVLSVFPLAAPEFFGKVNHGFHHVLWFAALLSVSRCGDALALDAVIHAWRRPALAAQFRRPSRAYGLPFCFVWLSIGVLYFFPGFWKAWLGGSDWVFGHQLEFIMHNRWFQLQPWSPPFRIDEYPLLYRLLGLATLVFELFFILLLFTPRTRLLAAATGLGFHAGTYAFMRISFYPLMACYVAFFDWQAIARRVGRRLFGDPVHAAYPADAPKQHRLAAVLTTLDVMEQVAWNGAEASAEASNEEGVPSVESSKKGRLVIWEGAHRREGAEAWRAVAKRVPLLWPLLPLLYLLLAPGMGARLLDAARSAVAPREQEESGKAAGDCATSSRRTLLAVTLVGSFILAASVFYGVNRQGQAWPFACHPTFSGKYSPFVTTVTVDLVDDEGHRTSTTFHEIITEHTPWRSDRAARLLERIANDKNAERARRRLDALWGVVTSEQTALKNVRQVQFFSARFAADPDSVRAGRPFVERELLFDFTPSAPQAASVAESGWR